MSVTEIERPARNRDSRPSSPVIDRPYVGLPTIDRPRAAPDAEPMPRTRRRPISEPSDLPAKRKSGARSERRVRNALQILVNRAALLLVVYGVGYAGTALSGHVLLESARRQEDTEKHRLAAAERAESILRTQVLTLMDRKTIDAWAASQRFVPSDAIVAGQGVNDPIPSRRRSRMP